MREGGDVATKPTPPLTGKKTPKEDVYSGTAAEYFVAGELLRRGATAFVSIGTHKQIDVLVRSRAGSIVTVDVKAVHGPKPIKGKVSQASWNMPKVTARGGTPDFFYVLVWLGKKHGDFASPEYFVVP